MGGCNLNNNCTDCGDCAGTNYGPVASSFLSVPDNFNSVTNFVPKLAVYRALRVCDIATENGKCGEGKCCDDGSTSEHYNSCCDKEGECDSLGFIRYPTSIRPAAVQVCGSAECVCDKGAAHLGKGAHYEGGNCCSSGGCVEDNNLGFVNWPPVGYFKSVKACGPIDEQVCCPKGRHAEHKCHGCNVVAGPCKDKRCGYH